MKQIIGSWQCDHCHLASMGTWRGAPNPDDAPTCCGGKSMLPYRITPRNEDEMKRDVKTVSGWIDEIEAEDRLSREGKQ